MSDIQHRWIVIMHPRTLVLMFIFCTAAMFLATSISFASQVLASADGTINLPAVALPESSLLREETRRALANARAAERVDAESTKKCPSIESADRTKAAAVHKCETDTFRGSPFYKRLRDRYAVEIRPEQIGGVHTEIFTPAQGIAPNNQNRVLVNVHGGGFLGGWHTNSDMESIPIAAVGRVKVVSVDYREAPEYAFPAASEDVNNVYRALLRTYPARNIGIYGCSAGALLTAESVALLLKRNLPIPGGLGMLCGGASYYSEGDSGYIGRIVYSGTVVGRMVWGNPTSDNPYFKTVDPKDALAFPITSPSDMAKFPPSLVISGTRDPALSSSVHTHSVLVSQGVEASLHVWEGLGHAFFYDIDLPESREVYGIIVNFFDSHLGK